ncbi:MAG: hypothetical protein JSS35_18855 [Proteobacteria bacterium]|nr:hypothetical protein [Pseudomonadota bacterium]
MIAVGLLLAVGVFAGVAFALKFWLDWARPSEAVAKNIEQHFKDVGSVMNISRMPLVSAKGGFRAYRVQVFTPQGFTISPIVEASDEAVRGP